MKVQVLKSLSKILLASFIAGLVLVNGNMAVFADGNTPLSGTDVVKSVLPQATVTANECETTWNPDVVGAGPTEEFLKAGGANASQILGCGIKTGNIKLYMIPYYIRSVLEFIIGISGLVCVGAIVFGGYWYLFAGVSEDKERGKKAIQYGIIGMVLTLLAWAIVNVVISLLTM
ncbi:MAG: pilin [Candidatus Gracilibacteria bacterium]|jgi:hypothetical protein